MATAAAAGVTAADVGVVGAIGSVTVHRVAGWCYANMGWAEGGWGIGGRKGEDGRKEDGR